jgi:hypothetical protein
MIKASNELVGCKVVGNSGMHGGEQYRYGQIVQFVGHSRFGLYNIVQWENGNQEPHMNFKTPDELGIGVYLEVN